MTDDKKSGIAILAGALGGILTMAIHPVPGPPLADAAFSHMVMMAAIAHSIAMVSFIVMFLGLCGLTRRLAAPDRLAFAAIVTFAFAGIALMLATSISGFIVPTLMKHMRNDIAAVTPQWHIVIDAVFQFNQAFSKIYTVAASAAIVLWSASALRNGGLTRGLALYGCVIGPVLTVLVAVGHLKLNVHGMAVVVVAQAIWFLLVALQLLQTNASPAATH